MFNPFRKRKAIRALEEQQRLLAADIARLQEQQARTVAEVNRQIGGRVGMGYQSHRFYAGQGPRY